jgi:hypothetical protein
MWFPPSTDFTLIQKGNLACVVAMCSKPFHCLAKLLELRLTVKRPLLATDYGMRL